MNRYGDFFGGARRSAIALIIVTVAVINLGVREARSQDVSLRIGIIGTGNIGSTLARFWAETGHELVISSRHPENLVQLAAELGPRVRAGLPREAAAFGDVVVIAVPYYATPQIGADYSVELAGKIVIDTGNPVESRDGAMALQALSKGSGIASSEFLPETRLVRAFNAISAGTLRTQSNREPEPIAIPIASDDEDALDVVGRLIRDAGYEPVVIGDLARARDFDLGGPLAREDLTATEMRRAAEALPGCWFAAISIRLCMWFF